MGPEYFDMAGRWEPQIGQRAMETMSEMGAEASETVSELADRVAGIAQVLTENGHSVDEVAVAMKVKYEKVRLSDEWQTENLERQTSTTMQEWAANQLSMPIPAGSSVEDQEVLLRA